MSVQTLLLFTSCIAYFASPPPLLCFVAVLSCDSVAPTAAVKETHMFYLWLLWSPIMALERKPGYILLQLTKILLCPTSKYMFLSKKYRYRYRDAGPVFPDIGLIPSFAVLPAPRLSSSPNVLHMKKMYFLFFWGEGVTLSRFYRRAPWTCTGPLFFFNNGKPISAKQNGLLFFCFFFFLHSSNSYVFPENFTLPLGQPSS